MGKGDIIKVDAIVNPANSQMLECFVPCHRCTDNGISQNYVPVVYIINKGKSLTHLALAVPKVNKTAPPYGKFAYYGRACGLSTSAGLTYSGESFQDFASRYHLEDIILVAFILNKYVIYLHL